jgi:REP element-mobilizing transposase RayT
MDFYPGHTYHIYNQGNNREPLFFEEKNYDFFVKKMRKRLLPHCDILAWCLMPNHFHWMVKVHNDYIREEPLQSNLRIVNPLNRAIGTLQSSYARAINNAYERSGSLFRLRAKAKNLSKEEASHDNYALTCFFYIHQNPLRAGLVNKMEQWPYSSFRDYCELRKGNLCNIKLAKELLNLPDDRKDFYKVSYQTIPEDIIQKLY